MSVVVIGLNHRTAGLDLLERVAVDAPGLPKVLHDLISRDNISEAVVLSTCNRTEIIVHAERFHGAFDDVRNVLCGHGFVAPEDLADHLTTRYDSDAVSYLFAIAAGLESAVLGENEILGQVRGAWESARTEGTVGPVLGPLFRHAIEVGKRARTETSISRHLASVSQAAVAMADQHLGTLAGRSILVLGAGDMGAGVVQSLREAGAHEILIANRTWANAVALAERLGGTPVELAGLPGHLASVDLLLTSTGASSLMIEHADLVAAVSAREGRPLVIVDIAVPRDVDPAARDLAGVTLLDMDDLRRFADLGVQERRREVDAVRAIVADEVARYTDLASARELDPLITEFRSRAEALRQAELERHRADLAALSPTERDLVDAITRGVLNKLLHQPTVRLKDAAGTPRGVRLADALRDLHDL